jgi:cobyric acid synthase CobQ/L-threonine-O-3-phosphate decarboxylase
MRQSRHGGDVWQLADETGVSVGDLLDFSANINPLGPPDWLRTTINAAVSDLVHYPDPACTRLVAALARHHAVSPDTILAANGSAEIIGAMPQVTGSRRAVIPVPSYVDYRTASENAGLEVLPLAGSPADCFRVDLHRLRAVLRPGDLVFLGQPGNPIGSSSDPADIRALARVLPGCHFFIDEAFIDFTEGLCSLVADRPDNLLVSRSFTKILAIPGLRLGYLVASPSLVEKTRRLLPPWSVNHLAQQVGMAALGQADDYLKRTRALVAEQRRQLGESLARLGGLTVFPAEANFLLLRLDRPGLDAQTVADKLIAYAGIAVRTCANFEALDEKYLRVAVRNAEDNHRLCQALDRILNGARKTPGQKRRRATPALMFQGTTSGAGKSLLTAALCRILLEDGLRVAPFKSQNMSLNSFVARDGGEMGRAQVVQAQACRLPPDVRMNPILLKPNSDTGAQVIVLGRPVATMSVERYIGYKPQAFERAKQAYDELAAEQDVMVIEGAGSPAEVNLSSHDIANMAMARHARARVLLVGDIDRGGVFAAFAGTLDALKESERSLVAGFVINRFRGRARLLDEGLCWVQRVTGRPVVGVVPLLPRLGLPEEDSVALDTRQAAKDPARADRVDIGVVRLPHISNFTDFDALESEPDVRLRFHREPDTLGETRTLVIPGSKNVMADAGFLRESGWSRAIRDLAGRGGEIVGICGGFQLLGESIADPHGLESGEGSVGGLGLLSVRTVLQAEKTLRRVAARHLPSGYALHGYEIHHGLTSCDSSIAIIERSEGGIIGTSDGSGRVWGTYLHGLFDADDFRRHFINGIRERAGLDPLASGSRYDVEPAIQRLADAVRCSLDLGLIYRELRLA